MLAKLAATVLSIPALIAGLITSGFHPIAEVPPQTQAAAVALPAGVTDTITITNASGAAQTSYPYQFGRPFVQGEIKNYPQVLVNGSAIQTQADVKNRYPDGSVKFAVISVVIPSIPTSGTVTLSFQNQSTGNNTPLSTAQMLDPKFDFDSQIKLTSGGVTKAASARTMLQNGDYTYWASGPVATTIVLQDNSTARKYDLGFDALRPIHPQFVATFWPALNKVSIRASGFDWNTTALEDVKADLAITLGNASAQTVYTNPGLVMVAATGWTKQFWLGGAPEQKINIDNNIAYIAATKYLPNFDVPMLKDLYKESTIASAYSTWLKKATDLYQAAEWTIYMPTTGGRGDIGLYTTWDMQSLITGDWRYRAIALGQANLATSWNWNIVEGDASKKYDEAQTVPAIGLPVSIFARPNDWLFDNRNPSNTIVIQGARITPPVVWSTENAHQPEPFSVSYMTTGDPFYLQELQNWAGAAALKYAICTKGFDANCGSARSANPVIAGITDQIRGNAWTIRTRARAGLFAVDGSPEQQYFTDITNQALAVWDGQHDVTNSAFANTVPYQKGATIWHRPLSPLHFFTHGPNGTEGLWQDYYVMIVLGQLKEYGYQSGSLLTWFSKVLTEQFNEMPPNGTYEIKLLGQYYTPIKDAQGNYYSDWQQIQSVIGADGVATTLKSFNATSNYAMLGAGAGAMIANEPGGSAAWNWLYTNVHAIDQNWYRGEPSWDILPRNVNSTPLPPPVFTPIPTVPVIPATTTPTTTPPVNPPATTTPSVTGAPLKNISITGDFTQTTTCATAAAKSPCTISLVFKPTAGGVRTGSLSFTDAITGIAYKIALSGIGVAATTSPAQPPTAGRTLTGTDGNDTITLAKDVVIADGKGGNDIADFGFLGKDSTASWFRIIQNADGSYAVQDVHASGYKVVLKNVETLKFGNGTTISLGGATGSGTTNTPDPNPHKADVLGTDSGDTLTIAKPQISVDGRGGYDIVFIDEKSSDVNRSWFKVVKNSDGSYTAQDVHATGYKVTLWNVEELKFNSGKNLVLATISTGPFHALVGWFQGVQVSFELALQSVGRSLALLFTDGATNLAAPSAAISTPPVSFGSVTVGKTAAQTLTISFTSAGITGITH